MAETKYTVVQHSGFGYKEDPTFEKGLESRRLTSKRDQDAVIKAGGILFLSYSEAETFAERAMYPEGYTGLIPNVQGTFSRTEVDGLRVYVPVRQVKG